MSVESAITGAVASTAALALIVLVFVGLRLYVRLHMTRAFSWDDALLLVATCFHLAMSAVGWASNALGNINYGTLEDEELYLKYFMVSILLYLATTSFIKLSVSVFLLRLAVRPIHRWIVYITAGVFTGSSFAFIFALVFDCKPTAYFWDKTIEGGTCLSQGGFFAACLVNAILSTLSDVILSLLPIWIIWDVQMSRRTKISVALLLSLGLLSSAATIIRIQYLHTVLYSAEFSEIQILYDAWGNIEAAVAIIAASMASMRPLLRAVLSRLGLSTVDKSYGRSKGTGGKSWGIKVPSYNGYIQSRDPKNADVTLRDLDPRFQNQPSRKIGMETNIGSGTPVLSPNIATSKTWGVTRVDQWNISEESLSPSNHTEASGEPVIDRVIDRV